MKKLPVILLIALLIMVFASTLLAAAETSGVSADYSILLGDTEHYYDFTAPADIAAGNGVFAALDSGEILIFNAGISNMVAIPYEGIIKEMLFVGGYLFVLDESFSLNIYGITDGMEESSAASVVTGIAHFSTSLAYDSADNVLYVFNITSIETFNISFSSGISISHSESIAATPAIVSSNCIAYSSGKLFIYKISSGYGQLYSMDLTTSSVSPLISNLPAGIRRVLANTLYLLLIEENKIVRYYLNGTYLDDLLTTGAATDSTVTDIGGAGVYGDLLYVSNPSYSAVKLYTIASTGAVFNNMYGSRGTSASRLNSPSAAASSGNKLYVADTLNDRIAAYTLNGSSISGTAVIIGGSGDTDGKFIRPLALATDYAEGLWVADASGRLQYFLRGAFTASFSIAGVSSVTVSGDNTVYAASGSTIYSKTASDTSFNEFLSLSFEIMELTMSESGRILYVSGSGGVSAYSRTGALLPFSITYADCGISASEGIAVDYNGNMYILDNSPSPALYRFSRNIDSFTLSDIWLFDNPEKEADNPLGITLNADGSIIITNSGKHNLIYISGEAGKVIVESGSVYDDPDEVLYPTRIARVIDESTLYAHPNNYENIDTVPAGTLLPVLNESDYNGVHYYYIESNGGYAYIDQSEALLLTAGEASFEYACSLHPTLDIYLYPSVYSTKLITGVPKTALLNIISNVAEYEGVQAWNWYEVEYNNTKGYVLKTEIIPSEMPEVDDTKEYSAKIRSPYLGEKIPLYAQQDNNSAVITELSDGTKVSLNAPLNTDDEFTLIKYGDFTGYVRTEYLMESGLTTGQILSIILAALTFSATAAVFVISRIIKRENNK